MKYIATASTLRTIDGVEYNISSGVTTVDETHPLYRDFPELFEKAKHQPPPVERATKAPGERRGE